MYASRFALLLSNYAVACEVCKTNTMACCSGSGCVVPNSTLVCEEVDDTACMVDCRLSDSHNGPMVKCQVKKGETPMGDGRIRARLDDTRCCVLDPKTGICSIIEDDQPDDEPEEELGGTYNYARVLLSIWWLPRANYVFTRLF